MADPATRHSKYELTSRVDRVRARMEDGIVIAEVELRGRMADTYLTVWARCEKRRAFMNGVLGFEVPEGVLLLSDMPGLVVPFLPDPKTVIVLE